MNVALVSILWPLTLVAAAAVGWALRPRTPEPPAAPPVAAPAVVEPAPPTQAPDPRAPWVEGAQGLEFCRRCTQNLVQSVVDSLRQTSDPLTANLLDIRASMGELAHQIHRHDDLIQSGHDLERVETLAQGATAAMEGVGEATLGSARAFEGHVQALKRSQDSILETSAKIGDLADRINVLSINASIEAARAGAAGRGFKVIAAEVKALAQESAQFLHSIEATVSETRGLFAGIRADLEAQKALVHRYLQRQGESFAEFRHEFSSQRQNFQNLVAAIVVFLGRLHEQMSTVSPVAQTQEIAVQELENLSLVVSDLLSALASQAAPDHGPEVTPAVAEAWAPAVARRLTTSRERQHLHALMADLGARSESGPPVPTIELF